MKYTSEYELVFVLNPFKNLKTFLEEENLQFANNIIEILNEAQVSINDILIVFGKKDSPKEKNLNTFLFLTKSNIYCLVLLSKQYILSSFFKYDIEFNKCTLEQCNNSISIFNHISDFPFCFNFINSFTASIFLDVIKKM